MNEHVKLVVELLALLGALLTAVRVNITLGQRSKKFTDDEERNERVALKVEGDPKEQRDSKIRRGLEGRVEQIENSEETRNAVFKAVCIAFEIPATSKEHVIVAAIREKFGLPPQEGDHHAAHMSRQALIAEQHQRFERRDLPRLPYVIEQPDPWARGSRPHGPPLRREEDEESPRTEDTGGFRRRAR